MDLLSFATDIARKAGTFLRENVGNISTIEEKSNEINLVTDIDKRSEAMIISMIREKFPDHDILAEESGRNAGSAEYRWVIDPLDGTTNFTHAIPIFCVSIGVEHRGEIVAGTIYDPMHDELFSAEKGSGAFCNGKRISVSKEERMLRSLVITGFPYDLADNPGHAIDHFDNFVVRAQAVRRLGSAAIDLAYVACGRAEGFWEVKLHPWDMAAGMLLVKEAGGTVTNFKGEETNIYTQEIVASNGKIHSEMLKILEITE